MGQITRLKDNGGGSIYPLTTADAVYVGNTNLSTKLNNLTKSDVGLNNVENTKITVTSSSVSNGTTTFNKYTHPDTAGNKHIPSGGSTGQFLKYGGSSGTASWSSLSKSDVGLGNVLNQEITITETSVSNGTKTFSKYTHPTGEGNKHIPSGGSTGKFLKYSSAGTAAWASLSKSDVGLSNVENTKITVTSSSVSDGTNTFSQYTHPTTAGNKHIPSGGETGQYLKYSASGTAAWSNIGLSDLGISIDSSDKTINFGNSDIYRCAPNPENTDRGRFLKCNSDGYLCYADLPVASNSIAGIISSTDKQKLDSIESGANAYIHPTSAGYKHIPSGGSTGQFLKYSASGTATWASLSKSDVGLDNVSNQTITVTSSSVTDGTNTFSKYTHPTTAGNKHIPSGGSSGQYLKYSASGTAQWADIPTVTGSVNGLVKTPNSNNVSTTVIGSAYYMFATSAAGQTPGWYKLPSSAFTSYSVVGGKSNGLVPSTAAANMVDTQATSDYYIFATSASGQNPHWYKLPSTAFTTLTNQYNDSSNTSTTALSALGAYNMYNEIQGTLGEISSLLDSI